MAGLRRLDAEALYAALDARRRAAGCPIWLLWRCCSCGCRRIWRDMEQQSSDQRSSYYADETVTLWHGDMREIVPTLRLRADLVIADPPYGETSLKWDRWPGDWPDTLLETSRSMWCFGSMRMFLDRAAQFRSWKLSQDLVWSKQNGTGFASDRFRRTHEHALHWYQGLWREIYHETPRVAVGIREPGRRVSQGEGHERHLGKIGRGTWMDDGSRLMQSVIKASNMWRRGAVHPTEKPVSLLDPMIRYACPPGGTVLDPFAGSGATAAAARLSGRRVVLIEADERYCEAIARRLQQPVLPLA